jgi:nicotinamide mononucleotide transporter
MPDSSTALDSLVQVLNNSAFSIFNSPASWTDVIGAGLGVAMVLCNIRQIHWGWPLAFLSSAMYFLVFWNSKLFGDAALQIFFAVMSLWGWTQWLRGKSPGVQLVVHRLNAFNAIKLIAICALLWVVTGFFLLKFTSTDVPWWDGFTTALSIVATVLLARKYLENWMLWVIVNAVSIALFACKGLWLTVGLYALFALMAIIGWRAWRSQVAEKIPT